MYISIGSDMSVRSDTIIGVFDLDNASWSKTTRDFLRQSEENGEVFSVSEELPRTAVLTEEFGMRRIYLTSVSGAALARRMRAGSRRQLRSDAADLRD